MPRKHFTFTSGKAETNGRPHVNDEHEAVKAEITIMAPPEKEDEEKKFVPRVKRTDPRLTGQGHFNPKSDAPETAEPAEETGSVKKKRAKKVPEQVKAIVIYSLDTAPKRMHLKPDAKDNAPANDGVNDRLANGLPAVDREALEARLSVRHASNRDFAISADPAIPYLTGLVVTPSEDGKEPQVTHVLLRGGRTRELFGVIDELGFARVQSDATPSFDVVPVEKGFGLLAGSLSHAAQILLANRGHYNLPPGLTKTLENALENPEHLQGMPLSEAPLNPPSGWTLALNGENKANSKPPAPRKASKN